MTYKEAMEFLNTLNKENKKKVDQLIYQEFDPKKVARILSAANIKVDVPIIHITGTNGKGSVSNYLAALLSNHYKVGMYNSPHVLDFRERIRVFPYYLEKKLFTDIVEKYQILLKTFKATYFDCLTFIAMVYFLKQKCECIILEVGMGGRLDSTNFYDKTPYGIFTEISFDHMQILGDTLEKITTEKMGILRPGQKVLIAHQTPEVTKQIVQGCKDIKAIPFLADEIGSYKVLQYNEEGTHVQYTLNGGASIYRVFLYQYGNAAIRNFYYALCMYFIIHENFLDFYPLTQKTVQEVASMGILGRMQKVLPNLVIDVGHNEKGVENFITSMKMHLKNKKVILLLGMLKGKEFGFLKNVLEKYQDFFKQVIIFDFVSSRESNGKEIFESVKELPFVTYLDDIRNLEVKKEDFYLETGSFYSVRGVLVHFGVPLSKYSPEIKKV